jgi:hypothetical protein
MQTARGAESRDLDAVVSIGLQSRVFTCWCVARRLCVCMCVYVCAVYEYVCVWIVCHW